MISLRYHRCFVIDGKLWHGLKCRCTDPWRDSFFNLLNMPGAE